VRRPDFFIVGAPKCGTTAMYEYLKQHSEIFMPRVKETYFFARDLSFRFGRCTQKEYYQLFSEAQNEKRIGEVSTWYLYSKVAAFEIKTFSPQAQIIIMLRNPIDVMYAWHSQLLYVGDETIKDFEGALAAEEDRKKGKRIPKNCQVPEGLFYREVVKFSKQVKRYIDVFGRSTVHIIIFDDFKADTPGVYRDVLRFLGVNDNFRPISFAPINPNKKVRSRVLRDALKNPTIRLIGKVCLPSPRLRTYVRKKIKRFNTIYVPRPPMAPELRRRLQEEFFPEVKALSDLLGRDLTHWCRD